MTYIVIEIQKNANGAVSTLVNAFESKNAADNKFHLVMAAAAISNLPKHSCIMITEDGSPIRYDSYTHEPEPEEEPEAE